MPKVLKRGGILNHYTKKEGGTFSFFALGSKYIELTNVNKDSNKEDNKSNRVEYKNINDKYYQLMRIIENIENKLM